MQAMLEADGGLAPMASHFPLRSRLADLLGEVADRREHIMVTRRGRPAAVLIPIDEYEALEETAEILSDEGTLAAIRDGLQGLANDDLVPVE